jgi:hypothetical protein
MRASHADRERVAEVLREAAGDGRIDVGELEERLEQTYAAKTYAELQPILRDLPTTGVALPAPSPPRDDRLEPWKPAAPAVQRVGGTASGQTAVAIFGGAERKGVWVVPSKFVAVAVFGGVDLDLRQARFETSTVEIQEVAVFGGIDVIVPPDVEVRVEGVGIMGGFGRPSGDDEPLPPGAPVVKVTGLALFGGVDVKVKRLSPPKPRKLPKGHRHELHGGSGS